MHSFSGLHEWSLYVRMYNEHQKLHPVAKSHALEITAITVESGVALGK